MAAEAMAWAAMRCARTRGDLVARFARQGTEWQLTELTPVEESVDSGEARLHIAGRFGLAPGYAGLSRLPGQGLCRVHQVRLTQLLAPDPCLHLRLVRQPGAG